MAGLHDPSNPELTWHYYSETVIWHDVQLVKGKNYGWEIRNHVSETTPLNQSTSRLSIKVLEKNKISVPRK